MALFDRKRKWFDQWGPKLIGGKAYGRFAQFADDTRSIRQRYKGGDYTQEQVDAMRQRVKNRGMRNAPGRNKSVASKNKKILRKSEVLKDRSGERVLRSRRKAYRRGPVKGQYAGLVGAMENRRTKNGYKAQGITLEREFEQVVIGANEAVGIGHSACVPQMYMHAFAGALLRKLFHVTGERFFDFNAPAVPASSGLVIIFYHRPTIEDTTVQQLFSWTPVATRTYAQIYQDLANQILTNISTNDFLYLTSVEVYRSGTGAGEKKYVIPLDKTKFEMYCTSVMLMQNTTVNGDGTNTTDNTTSNPLHGRGWIVNSNSMMPLQGQSASGELDFANTIADSTYGLILSQPHSAQVAPPNHFKNAKWSGSQHLEPGEIKKSECKITISMGVNKFLLKMGRWMRANSSIGGTTDRYLAFGPSKYYEYAHMIHGPSDDLDQPQLEYKVHIFCGGKMTFKTDVEARRLIV